MSDAVLFPQIAVVGVGLLGGSLGLAAKDLKLCHEVVGVGRSALSLDEAKRMECIDRFETDLPRGIAEADLVRVAEPYVRLEASRSRETGGVGLGLSIVKDIALLHGGELLLANRPQGGLSATLVLPRK